MVPWPPAAGMLAVSGEGPPTLDVAEVRRPGEGAGGGPVTLEVPGDVRLLLDGVTAEDDGAGGRVALLAAAPRRHEAALDAVTAAGLLARDGGAGLREALPPFAASAFGPSARGVTVGVDALGFRHLYHRSRAGWAGVSTSARALARCGPLEVDRTALAVQSLLGWQLGDRTLFEGVSTLAPGARAVLADRTLTITSPADGAGSPSRAAGHEASGRQAPARLDEAVRRAAELVRAHVNACLDDHPDLVLQLTGGQDSRILLGAVPPARRRGLRVMTLAVPGSPDVAIAAMLARTYGMRHEIVDVSGLEGLEPPEAHALAVGAARRLECAGDPLAWASIAWAEAKLEQRPRLSGLGGEVARGFYYFGRVSAVPVTRARVERLADWRMFANESVAAEALDPDFRARARETALDCLQEAFASCGQDWLSATDDFYLLQRMRRWAGVLASAVCLDRVVINPMLDDRFLSLVRALPPADKRASRFLARLSCALDEELSAVPLDGRPAPAVYARGGLANRSRMTATTVRKVVGKVRQRVARSGRAPVGGEVLADKLARHYATEPGALDGLAGLGVFRQEWLEGVGRGAAAALSPATAALMVNLEAALELRSAPGVRSS